MACMLGKQSNSMWFIVNIYVLFLDLTLYDAGLILWWRIQGSLALFCILWHSSALTLLRSERTSSKDHWSQQGCNFESLGLSSCLLICKWGFCYLSSLRGLTWTDVGWVFSEVLIFTEHVFFLVCSCRFWNSFCFSFWLLVSGRTIWVVQNFQWNKGGNTAFFLPVICAQFY